MDCSPARTKDPAEWLETCPEFLWPLANQMRKWILNWEPDLQESIRWNMLRFSGRKLICGLSARQRHLGLSFFRGTELPDPANLFLPGSEQHTNIRSIRLTSHESTNRRALEALIHAAVALDADDTTPPAPKVKRKPWPMPEFFRVALAHKKNRRAAEGFKALAPTYQREYLVWLTMAKLPATRARRLKEALAALTHGRKWAQRKG